MKTKIIDSEEITREMVIKELEFSACFLTKDEINEYLDVLSAIDDGETVYNLTTNKGEYLLYVRGDAVTNTKEKYKRPE